MMSSPLTGAKMKARKMTRHAQVTQANEADIEYNPDSAGIPAQAETDTVSALLRGIADRRNHESARFAYQDIDEDDYMDKQELHRVVEDLQFGHDLRL